MIILKVHFSDNVTINSESNPPIGCYRDAAFAFPDAPERMKLPARHGRHLREVVGKLQGGQDRFDLSDAMGREAARVIIFVKASEAFMPKFADRHDRLYGITVRLSRHGFGGRSSF